MAVGWLVFLSLAYVNVVTYLDYQKAPKETTPAGHCEGSGMIWREKRVWLIILGLMLAADVFFFVTYRVQFQKRKEDVELRRVQAEARLAKEHSIRVTAEESYARYIKLQADLD